MKKAFWFVQFLLIILFAIPLAVIPYNLSLRVGGILGTLLFYAWKSRRNIALTNLRDAIARNAVSVQEDPQFIIRQNFSNYVKSVVEIIKIYFGRGNEIINSVDVRGLEHFEKASGKGKGVIFITGHCGNWELLALVAAERTQKAKIVARRQNNPYINRFMEKTREKYGNTVIYKKGALKQILSSLRKNEVVGILIDQNVISSEGVVIEFLGKKAYTTKMPALIAMKTGAPVIPGFIQRVNGGHRIEFLEEIELSSSEDTDEAVISNTLAYSQSVENYIKNNPTEWLWMHRRWKRPKD
ncbi:MAG: lysophospholipid acyltransferase family protein [Nitrospiraceae bacterium]|nr:MAG: lysophospholipid acyltransferase family protein [Nitrospiraceae bacterium]